MIEKVKSISESKNNFATKDTTSSGRTPSVDKMKPVELEDTNPYESFDKKRPSEEHTSL